MTKEQFIEALINDGYKVFLTGCYTTLDKRNNSIAVQEWNTYINIFYQKKLKNGSYEYNQHSVSDFAKALKNILKFERKLKR